MWYWLGCLLSKAVFCWSSYFAYVTDIWFVQNKTKQHKKTMTTTINNKKKQLQPRNSKCSLSVSV